MAVVSLERKRQILDFAANSGQIFSVTFKKADGTIREMQCKKFVEAALASGDRRIVQKSTTAHKPNLYSVVDIKVGQFRSINLDTLLSCKVAGIRHEFDL